MLRTSSKPSGQRAAGADRAGDRAVEREGHVDAGRVAAVGADVLDVDAG